MNTRYVDSVDVDRAMTTAIDAMLNDLDPYTEFISAEEASDFMAMSTTGEYGGIGSVIMMRKGGGVQISDPYEGSPAALAGLRPGDRIVKIDTMDTRTWDTKQVSDHLKGQANTTVHVVVERPYVHDSVLTFDIVRRKIQMPSVPYFTALDGGIGYIQLTKFTETSADEVRDALLSLKRDKAIKSLILDLRGNGGGLVESAIKIANFFVPKNTEIIRTKGRLKTEEKIYKTTQKPIDTEIPLCILVDGGSASASEIVAGSMQDLDRAVVVGSRSFGKGLVQTTVSLPFDNMLKVTTAKYYIPSGRLIQAIDYSHRDADGNIQRTPDSLTNVFHTVHGREVRDGGGIKPDVEVKADSLANIALYLASSGHDSTEVMLTWELKFMKNHPTIAPAKDFEISDADYEDFKKAVIKSGFKYDRESSKYLETLVKIAKFEGYYDEAKPEFDALEKKFSHNIERDLDYNKESIKQLLAADLVAVYYYQRGAVENSLRTDKQWKEAVKLLNDEERYKGILKGKASL